MTAPTDAPPAPDAPPADTPPASPPAGDWDGKVESLPEPVQKMIRDLRKEAGDRRTALTAAEQRQQDVVRAFAKAAGIALPDDDKGPDPEALTRQLTAAQTAQRQAAVELAVYRAAGKHQGDPDALLDSRTFLRAVENLDPAADDFAVNVDAAIKATVEANPKLKTGQVPGASGADHTGRTGGLPDPADNARPGRDRIAAAFESAART